MHSSSLNCSSHLRSCAQMTTGCAQSGQVLAVSACIFRPPTSVGETDSASQTHGRFCSCGGVSSTHAAVPARWERRQGPIKPSKPRCDARVTEDRADLGVVLVSTCLPPDDRRLVMRARKVTKKCENAKRSDRSAAAAFNHRACLTVQPRFERETHRIQSSKMLLS